MKRKEQLRQSDVNCNALGVLPEGIIRGGRRFLQIPMPT
jgi:hypothetical protein